MADYRLDRDGDSLERLCWAAFVRDQFPSYATVWASYVVPLTRRPLDIGLKSDAELRAIDRGEGDLCNAQLHYTTLAHLARVWNLMRGPLGTRDTFLEAIVRLAAATDVADELLERVQKPGAYGPWDDSPGARRAWRKANRQQHVQEVRDYRNRLLHGRVPPSIEISGREVGGIHGASATSGSFVSTGIPVVPPVPIPYFPKLGMESGYLDWRRGLQISRQAFLADFAPSTSVVADAWHRVVAYLESEWKRILVPTLG